jgi:hypothetical protein
MKKTRLLLKPAIVLSASLMLFSCVSEIESPVIQEDSKQLETINTPSNGEENLRKRAERNYSERFKNQILSLDEEGNPTTEIPAYFPGTGVGNSTHMGKSLTFINQFAQFGPNGLETVAAPVSKFFEKELTGLGITNIPDEVSSITTDGKGNSVWFKAIKNTVSLTPEGPIANFVAEVEIIGGTGKFENATGNGEVIGSFNQITGEGSSIIKGRIEY